MFLLVLDDLKKKRADDLKRKNLEGRKRAGSISSQDLEPDSIINRNLNMVTHYKIFE